jgi:hypothetical protein
MTCMRACCALSAETATAMAVLLGWTASAIG